MRLSEARLVLSHSMGHLAVAAGVLSTIPKRAVIAQYARSLAVHRRLFSLPPAAIRVGLLHIGIEPRFRASRLSILMHNLSLGSRRSSAPAGARASARCSTSLGQLRLDWRVRWAIG